MYLVSNLFGFALKKTHKKARASTSYLPNKPPWQQQYFQNQYYYFFQLKKIVVFFKDLKNVFSLICLLKPLVGYFFQVLFLKWADNLNWVLFFLPLDLRWKK